MIAVIDYGMGNLRSVQKALERAGGDAVITSDPEGVRRAEKIVVPGVGAFKDAMDSLERGGLIEPILDAIKRGTPYLGICLGMQILLTESEEFGRHKGFGIIPGRVVRFPKESGKIPHMGWNRVLIKKDTPLLDASDNGGYFYFVHSYYPVPEEPEVTAGSTDYGLPFCSYLQTRNIFATQFHPEKSQDRGIRLLKRFVQCS